MRKISLLIILNTLFAFSQTKTIEYNVSINEAGKDVPLQIKEYLEEAKANEKFVTFTLCFDDNNMKFSSNKLDGISDDNYSSILQISDTEDNYYRKINSDIIYKEKWYTDSKKFIFRKIKIKTDWEITTDKKIISNHECIKATCNLMSDIGDGKMDILYLLTAWYCPEIKAPFGPKGYGGLPGMILEVTQNSVTFTASKIYSNSGNTIFTIPNESTIQTESDFIEKRFLFE